MKNLQPRDYSRLSAVQLDVMDDVCNIRHISFSSGTYSTQATETLTIVSGVACGFEFTGGKILQRGQASLVDYDAVLRLPTSQFIETSDEIELIEKGEFIISGTFRPYSAPITNSSVQIVQLKRITA